ncbi:hypothetical protein SeGA_4597 [Salmonella enterica subsp. enterica serovar Gaminara str. A4-567]|uniref:Uncharacterized protein n=1 Tax=Salmonella schwarzengrund (strain CVM19633) TaxID=439843 RepID=A0A0N1QS42_SALSV|nr:hypothetical protein SeSA_A3582 [Salmonella enterica subsp. enterica serovar Schwarzengrund str. CVM19633]EDY27261.1 hypothetical protein SeSB_A3748 [Salmonella enterica subsp. enterica serovar Schwarzengrund str. SL480]EHC31650.1 hypothetical protein SeGA_4597 [Salmonella enterica subsp. enterica serovar Gaminara str. A4-567]EHC61336.1 hypothetical protein LTSEMIN_5170 [Salmonella enterica subsp. enterica serovar Minnesota str. A4-603]
MCFINLFVFIIDLAVLCEIKIAVSRLTKKDMVKLFFMLSILSAYLSFLWSRIS